MSRWTQFRVIQQMDEEIPATEQEAKVFLDNAWRHLLLQRRSLANQDALDLITSHFHNFDEIGVSHV